MSNVSIAQRCNRACTFCFAESSMRQSERSEAFMALDEFERALDFLARSNVPEVSLLGGEPTLHPEFCRLLDRAVERGFRVLVLTGGVVPEPALAHIARSDANLVSVMLNVVSPDGTREHERMRQMDVMASLGSRVVLALNIDAVTAPLDFALGLIDTFGLGRALRLGIAHPTVGGTNSSLHPNDYAALGERVAAFARRVRDARVSLSFDCGWVPCMFPPGFLDELGISFDEVGRRCSPIIDILPGLKTIHCYPLASLASEPLPEAQDGAWLADRLSERVAGYRRSTLYAHCPSCSWFQRGECLGGCIAGSVRRLDSIQDTRSA